MCEELSFYIWPLVLIGLTLPKQRQTVSARTLKNINILTGYEV